MYQTSQMYQRTISSSPLEYIAQAAVSYGTAPTRSYQIAAHTSANLSPAEYAHPLAPTNTVRYLTTSEIIPTYRSSRLLYHLFKPHSEYHFTPEIFLKPGREGIFIGKAEEIKEHLKDAFELMFHSTFPHDIKISICNPSEFRALAPHPSTIGLSINRKKQGLISDIFVLNDSLARVMLTLGHELGHVLTPTLDNAHDEEAKAYAFSLAWMKIIQHHNIAGLGASFIQERPAENGLHNVAFKFVEKLIKAGRSSWEIYTALIQKLLSSNIF